MVILALVLGWFTYSYYSKKQNAIITAPSDTYDHETKGAYWNLDTVSKPGYTKDNVYTQGALYIDDKGLRNKMYSELKANIDLEDVKIQGNMVRYTWKNQENY